MFRVRVYEPLHCKKSVLTHGRLGGTGHTCRYIRNLVQVKMNRQVVVLAAASISPRLSGIHHAYVTLFLHISLSTHLFLRSIGLIIRDDPAAVGDYIANYIAKRIRDFNPTPNKPFVLGLPTGSSPIPTYKALIKMVKEGKLS